MERRCCDAQIGLREGVAGRVRPSSTRSRHLNMISSVTGRTRCSNIGRTLCASQSLSSARLVASVTTSIPNRISASVTALT
jgi:hypothetical protein